jgi:hypothetical protein
MDKLEQYLDQVCRGIGGPRSLRQHVRQELREHLRDAAAEHQAAGMSEEEALARALADFGGPEQVGSELEAMHGHRLMTVVIDKAMQWKEKTMKAKWLWSTWAHLAVIGVIAMELFFIGFAVMTLLPRLTMFHRIGVIYIDDTPGIVWLFGFLKNLEWAWEQGLWWLAIAVISWAHFEWRVRSENKSFMRLTALGTTAAALTVVVVMTAGALVLPFMIGMPGSSYYRPFAAEQIAIISTSVSAIEQAAAKKDWVEMQEQANRASQGMKRLGFGPAIQSLTQWKKPAADQPSMEQLRAKLTSAEESLSEVQQGIESKDAGRTEVALKRFHEAFDLIEQAAKKSER